MNQTQCVESLKILYESSAFDGKTAACIQHFLLTGGRLPWFSTVTFKHPPGDNRTANMFKFRERSALQEETAAS